jgi:hypothetical protein
MHGYAQPVGFDNKRKKKMPKKERRGGNLLPVYFKASAYPDAHTDE